jgi:hypothetical protein
MRQVLRATIGAALFAAAGFALAAPASAQSYPRTYGSGENIMVEYGPMGQAALVGGGRVTVSQTSGMNVEIMHLDAMFAQQPREGFVPLTIGSGESQETVWVPQAMVDMVRRARSATR